MKAGYFESIVEILEQVFLRGFRFANRAYLPAPELGLSTETKIGISTSCEPGQLWRSQLIPCFTAIRAGRDARQQGGFTAPRKQSVDRGFVQHVPEMMCGDVSIRHMSTAVGFQAIVAE